MLAVTTMLKHIILLAILYVVAVTAEAAVSRPSFPPFFQAVY
jgi:hypothetical protein